MKLDGHKNLDKIRFMFFSSGESEFRQFEFNFQKFLVIITVSILCFSGIFWGSVAVCNILFQDGTSDSLAKTNEFLRKKIRHLQTDFDDLNGKMMAIEEDTEDLEVLVGLQSDANEPDSEIESLLSDNEMVLASLPIDYEYQTEKMAAYLTNLESRFDRAVDVQNQIEEKFLETRKEIKHIPSIRPVQGGRVTDKFGKRKDPFVERVRHHKGIDVSARYGTKIYAAASGVVEFIRVRYRLNKGYGRVVIINHGYGYKTLYGHLSKIKVKRGQRINRWDVVGLSGDTGRATGPHLHYEVWHNGRAQNPEDFILN